MAIALLLAALAVLLIGGFGAAALALRGRATVALGELAGLATLFGIALVTLGGWAACLIVPWRLGVWMVAALCLGAGAVGAGAWLSRKPRLVGRALFAAAVVPITALVGWLSVVTPMGWDGLLVWETKAEAIAVEDGMPRRYLHDDSRAWSHPTYPLLVPFLRAWAYAWAGGPHEGIGKAVEVAYFLAAAGLLAALASRLGRSAGVVALALLALTPLLVAGEGGATSGYADFPLAVYYLGAVLYVLFPLAGRGDPGDLRIAGWLAAALPFVKQEGRVLLACFVVLSLLALGRRALGPRVAAALAAPGLAVAGAWALYVRRLAVESAGVFSEPSLPLLLERLHLGDDIGAVMARLALAPAHWGWLWPLALLASVLGAGSAQRRRTLYLAAVIAVPLALLASAFLFSRWVPVTLHVESAFARLLLQHSLVAIALVASTTVALVEPEDGRAAEPANGALSAGGRRGA
jgi:hypothetical protein